MPYHDLNIQYASTPTSTPTPSVLSNTLAFASELGYATVALSTSITGKLPSVLPTHSTTNVAIPPSMTVLTRLTLTISDTSQNHRLASLSPSYNLIALRPTNEKALQLCCTSLSCDIISIDFSQRLPFILKFKTVSSAIQRGIRFEICYSPGITGGSDGRRNVIAGATSLIRATRGRAIILSSEAKNALGLRGPHDVINLVSIWGLSQERGKEAVVDEADKAVRLAKLKRESYRGVVAVVDDGRIEQEIPTEQAKKGKEKASLPTVIPTLPYQPNGSSDLKRKASSTSLNTSTTNNPAIASPTTETTTPEVSDDKPISKREQKRRAKKARFEANNAANEQAISNGDKDGVKEGEGEKDKEGKEGKERSDHGDSSSFPIKHETLSARTAPPLQMKIVNNSTRKKPPRR